FLERLVVADLRELPLGHSQLSVMTNAHGGIVDDTILNKYSSDAVYMVTNAGCADKDIAHMEATLAKARQEGMDVQYRVIDRSLVALQGPASMAVLQGLVGADVDLAAMPFMTAQPMTVAGHACYVTRGGYTGEDGFELSVDHAAAAPLVEALLAHPDTVRLAGLGAR
ncbi:glycine decarboxylase complex subunit T, partial [Caulochytrium protostelioides]